MTNCPVLQAIQKRDAEAEARLAGNAPPDPVYKLGWHEDAPKAPGTYRWRLNAHWEVVERTVDVKGCTYSHRFLQPVAVARVGGEWWY